MWSRTVSKNNKGVLLQAVITPELFPRLKQLSKSFQRIRYHRLRFEVVASWPSTASGTYVAGFIKDATDPARDDTVASTLLASGGTATKVWQSTEVIVNGFPDLYYTSSDPSSQRWSSPGSFVISLISPNSLEGNCEVFVHWDVTLSEPTYEAQQGEADDGFTTCLLDVYTSKGNTYLSKRKGSDWTPLEVTDFSPPLKNGDMVTYGSFRFGSVMNSSSTFSGVVGFHTIQVSGSYIYPLDDLGARSTQNFYDETYVLAKGEKGQVERKEAVFRQASWYLSPPPPSVPSPIERSWCHHGALSRLGGSILGPRISSSPDCTMSLQPESMIPISETYYPPLEPSTNSCSESPPSSVDKLSVLLERLMERLDNSTESSTKSSDFEVL